MVSYTITDPQGKTHTITGPAGASREQVIAKIRTQTIPKRPETDEEIKAYIRADQARQLELTTVKDVSRGGFHGVTNLAQFGVDVIEGIFQMVPGGESPWEAFAGKGHLQNIAEGIMDRPESRFGKMIEFGTEVGTPVGAIKKATVATAKSIIRNITVIVSK